MICELGRLVYEVKINNVGNEKKPVVNNRIAINQGKDRTCFIDIVAWGKNAETIGKYYKQGYEIFIEGQLMNKKSKTKDGAEFETVAILVDKIKFTNGNPKEFTEDPKDFL